MSANCAPPPNDSPPRQFLRTPASRRRLGTTLLRGGRLTKVAGVVASLAQAMGRIAPPLMALPSALAIGAATAVGFDSEMASAGCTRASLDSGNFHCTGQISDTIDFQVSGLDLSVALDSSATVTVPDQESGGGSGDAIRLDHQRRTTVTQDAGGGAISGRRHGIYLTRHAGNGDVGVSVTGPVTGRSADGVRISQRDTFGRDSRTIVSAASVTGAESGIRIFKRGRGIVSINATGAVSGRGPSTSNAGISVSAVPVEGAFHGGARSFVGVAITAATVTGAYAGILVENRRQTGWVSVTAAGSVTGDRYGIRVTNQGSGGISLSVSDSVTSRNGDAMRAVNGARGGDLKILAKDAFGGGTGIRATQSGTGALEIAVAGKTVGATHDGVFASGGAAAQGVTVRVREAGSVRGSATGIRAESLRGNLTISAAGSVSATHGAGVSATGSGGSLEISTAKIAGGSHGIVASNHGSGMLKITATGSVTGRSGDAINAVGGPRGANLEIFSRRAFGSGTGIHATQSGTGALEIAVAGQTVGATRDGVFASGGAAAYGVRVSVRRAGSVRGNLTGIRADSLRGDLAVTARGNVQAASGAGISAAATDGDVTVLVSRIGAATGGSAGVHAVQRGAGRVDVAVFGRAIGRSGDGIRAEIGSGGSGAAVRVGPEGQVSGGASGIRVESAGADLTVTADAPVTGRGANGISAQVTGGSGAIAISAASVAGSTAGIRVVSNGTGRISISATGVVSGEVGIIASANNAGGGGIAVSAADVNSYYFDGIRVEDAGRGSLSVKSTGAVNSRYNGGIRVSNSARGSSVTISANAVRGNYVGISAVSRGTGTLEVTARGAVESTAESGILVRDAAAGAGISVTAATVNGEYRGIDAYALGNGPLSVTARGSVFSWTESAIFAVHGGRGSVRVRSSSVNGGLHGIDARAMAEELVSVSATGHAIGATGSGILARSGERESGANAAAGARGTGDAIRVVAESATGQKHGIYAKRKGAGTLRVSATGSLLGRSGMGVRAASLGTSGGDIVISVADARGGVNGVSALQEGRGSVSITAAGHAIGGSGTGILLETGRSVGVSIRAGSATGATAGIRVPHKGLGAVSITATGAVVGSATHGIYASGGAGTNGIFIDAATVTGATHGIYTVGLGVGALSVSATGSVTGSAEDGIYAFGGPNINRISVAASSVTAAKRGINATHFGSGVLSVAASGAVTGLAEEGVRARTIRFAHGVAVAVSSTTGASHGINVIFEGRGTSSISASGLARGMSGSGIKTADTGWGIDIAVAAASAEGSAHGIEVSSRGAGAVTVTASGTLIGKAGAGAVINRHGSTSGGIAVSVADARGGTDGLAVFQHGGGAVSVTATGHAIGDSATGILLQNRGAGAAIRAGSATGATFGIQAHQTGGGALSITATGSIVGSATDGVLAFGGPDSTGVSVAVASATGGIHGINALSSGTGEMAVSASGAVIGRTGDGVLVQTGSSGAEVTVAVASATGATHGIRVDSNGSGTLAVSATGQVRSESNSGVRVRSAATAGSVTVAVASVEAKSHGIRVDSKGRGTLAISATGPIHGTKSGVKVRTAAIGAGVTVAVASVEAKSHGIDVDSRSSGTLSISALGRIRSASTGVYARNRSGGGDVAVSVAGVQASLSGITAQQNGTGRLSVSASRKVVGGLEDGIHAFGGIGATGVSIAAASVTGARRGIDATSSGAGSLTVAASGAVTGLSGEAVRVRAGDSTTGVAVAVASATGETDGISVDADGSGTLSVTSSGLASGMAGAGIKVHGSAMVANVVVAAASATGTTYGIDVEDHGSGTLSVTADGSLLGTTGNGVRVRKSGVLSGDVEISATDARGGTDGISVFLAGSGTVSITVTGHAVGDSANGILLRNGASRGNSWIAAGSATGARNGIHAPDAGRGILSITATGAVVGRTEDGIHAPGGPENTRIAISAATVTGARQGIFASNVSSGTLSVSATGSVTGKSGSGISATETISGTGLSIAAATVTGRTSGIAASSLGSGTMSVSASGFVRGGTGAGIEARSHAKLMISAASATGRTQGIDADNSGSGGLIVSATGSLFGETGAGVRARSLSQSGGNVVVEIADARGGINGVSVQQHGRGSVSITAAGHAVGGSANGILLANTSRSGGVTIRAASATGAEAGIEAPHLGRGTLSITATGSVTGSGADGMRALGGSESAGVSVVAATVTGARRGISATGNGTGMLSVFASGSVTGRAGEGIHVQTSSSGAGVTLSAATVTGTSDGISVDAGGSGTLLVQARGLARGASGSGLKIRAAASAANVTVAVGSASGAAHGIDAQSRGSGKLRISASGRLVGKTGSGVRASNSSSASGDVVVSVADASGRVDAVSVTQMGAGSVSVTSTGLVESDTANGIRIENAGRSGGISIFAGSVTGAEAGIWAPHVGSGTLLVAATGSVEGRAMSGIHAHNSANGSGIVVSAAGVSGGRHGIWAIGSGDAAMSITATGAVAGATGTGIFVRNGSGITVSAASVSGAKHGIWALGSGTAAMSITATGSVAGAAGTGIFARNGSSIAVSAAGVSGTKHGIWALSSGTAAMSITATGSVAGAAGNGIFARNDPAGSGISIAAAAATGSVNGIYAYNRGGGALHLTASGHVTGAADAGLRVKNTESGTSVTIAAASATGAQDGIRAQIAGGAASILASGAVVGSGGDGVFVLLQDRSNGLAMSVSSATGTRDGINVHGSASTVAGAIAIAASGQVSGSRFGVFAATSARSTSLSISVATVAGGASAIHARGNGRGSLSVVATGAVTSASGIGIDAINSPAGASLTVSAASVTGALTGIDALQSGTGALFVSASGRVLGRGPQHYGVRAIAGQRSAGIAIKTTGASGSVDGIRASSLGSGRVAVSDAGAVAGTNRYGIFAYNGPSGAGIAVVASSVTGAMHGILAQNRGSGDVLVAATGAVSGGAGHHGIYASNANARARGVTISAAGVSGSVDGIRAIGSGTGAISIMASEHVSTTGKHGIRAVNRAAIGALGLRTGGVSIIAASVTGAVHGIYALSAGAGSISVTATGATVGSASDGIHVKNASGESNARPGSVSVSAASATGGSRGIFAANYGTNALSITATGAVKGTAAEGIRAYNSGSGSSLTVSAAAVAGKGRGISARNLGDGATAVSASGNVVAIGFDSIGIDAYASGTTGTMTIRAAAVSGRNYGVLARNHGFGALRIALTGAASGTVRGGILANNFSSGLDMAVSAGGASGRAFGVMAHNRGAGALSVSLTGPASAISGPGISAINSERGSDLSVAATRVSGRNYGILARNLGAGDIAVTATGTVTGLAGEGIHVFGAKAGGSISVSAASVTGRSYAIRVLGMGAGSVSVTASGTVSSSVSEAIHAVGGASSTDLFIRAAGVKGWRSGIVASSTGDGDVTVRATGALTARGGDGIRAFTGSAGGHVTVGAAAITATVFGIHAHGAGVGSVSVSASGTVSARIKAGIHAYGAARGGNVTVIAAAVRGGTEGIRAQNLGTGAVSVLATGDVTGSGAAAIYASNSASGGALTVSAGGAVSGRSSGIKAINAGAGKMSVRAAGPVSGRGILNGDAGILAHNTASATDLELGLSIAVSSVTAVNDGINALNRGGGNLQISADGVSGDRGYGIRAFNHGVGMIRIVTSGPVTGSFGRDGIRAHSDSSGIGLSIMAGSVSGDRHGIFASSDGSGELSVSVSGSVTGGAGLGYAAIKTQTAEARSVIVEIKSGAAIAARSQVAILDGSGTAAVAIRAGATVSGNISLGAGSDELLFAGGDTSGVGRLDGGAGTDTLRFASGTIGITGGELAFGGYPRTASLEGWERVSIETGASVSGSIVFGGGSDELILGGGSLSAAASLDGGDGADVLRISAGVGRLSTDILLNWEKVLIDSAGAVSFFGSQTLRTGTLSNIGKLSLDDGAADDALAVTGDYSGGGTLVVNVNFETGTSDTLSVAGDVIGAATGISVQKVAGAGTPSGSTVDIVTVAGEVAESAFELIGGSLAVGNFTYSLDFVESERKFSLTSAIASGGGSGGVAALHGESAPLEGAGIATAMLAGETAPPADAGALAATPPAADVPTAGAPASAPPSESLPPADAAAIAMPSGKGAPPAAAAAATSGESASSIRADAAAVAPASEDARPESAGETVIARGEADSVQEDGREGTGKGGHAGAPKTAMHASAANREANAPPGAETSAPAVEDSVQSGPAENPAGAQGDGGSANGGAGSSVSGASVSKPETANSPESPAPEIPVDQGTAAANGGGAPSGSGTGTSGEAQARSRIAGTDDSGGASTDGASVQSGVHGDASASAGPVESDAQSAPERTDSPDTQTAAGAADGDAAHGDAAQGAERRSLDGGLPSIMRAAPAVLLNAYGRLRPLAERNPNHGIGRDGTHAGDRFRLQAYGASENLPKDASGGAVEAFRYGIRGEMDLLELERGSGIWTFGVMARQSRVFAESIGADGAQGLEAAGYDLGGAATWRGASGAYVGLQAKYGRIESYIMSETGEWLAEGAEFGFGAAGLEIGRRAALGAHLSLASSAQVSWSAVFSDAFAGKSGAHVDFGTDTAVKGHLGLAIEFARGALDGHISGGVLHDIALDSDATMNGVSGGEDFRGGAVEIAGEANWRIAERTSAHLRASHSADSGDRRGGSVSAGFSWEW